MSNSPETPRRHAVFDGGPEGPISLPVTDGAEFMKRPTYYIVTVGTFYTCLVEEGAFREVFQKIPNKPGYVRPNPNCIWEPMSGGFDTFCQECCIRHARAGLHASGDDKTGWHVKGIYECYEW